MIRSHSGPGAALRRLGASMLLSGLFLLSFSTLAGAQEPAGGTLVDVVQVDGVIDATIADFLIERIAAAEADDAEVLVLQLNTPGGLGVSMDAMLDAMLASEVPVVVWVGPSGAQAASAGMFIGYGAHVLAMAPATTIGAATPVDLGGGDLEDKVVNAAEARLLTLADLRGRSTDFARAAVRDGAVVAVSAGGVTELPDDVELPARIEREDVRVLGESQLASEGIADLVAGNLPAVLAALDGREVQLADGSGGTTAATLEIDQATANVRFNNMGLSRRVLHTVASPTLAYLLLIGGALTLLFEVFQPGFGVAGVTGIVLIGLALYGMSVLPVNWLAFGLVVLGLLLLAADLAVAGLGALTAGGSIALAVGSFLLFSGPPILRVSPWVIAGVVAFNILFFVVIMTTVLRAQGTQAMTGAEGMAGKVGVVRSMLNPEGHIFVAGALWRARAPEGAGKVKTGTKVRILGMNDRLTLDVELVDAEDGASVG